VLTTDKGRSETSQAGAEATKRLSLRGALSKLGPGLITGASDDDPSGIATYSQVGAQLGYALLWTMVLSYPLMAAIQEICGRIGRVTGSGLAANLRKNYPRPVLFFVLVLMSAANVFNLGADIGAMGSSVALLMPGTTKLFTIVFGLVSLLAVLFIPYTTYAKYLKWLTVSLFAYVAVAFLVHVPWRSVLGATLIPRMAINQQSWVALIAVLGTTISPYLFFWQASQEVEEVKNNRGEKALKRAPAQANAQLRRIHTDTLVGMAFSNAVAFFIILTAASTLHTHGITNVSTCAQAASALTPIAGHFAGALFVCGIVGTGLLAVPILAASAAYAISEGCKCKTSLQNSPRKAPGFYAVITFATAIGLIMNFFHIDPIRSLVWAAVLNGIVAAPLMAVIMLIASSRKVMGKFLIPRYLRCIGWLATAVMAFVSAGVVLTWK
jgi:NRAMP (natural resistance-associated macrophage protein)-like metal ion transporter